MRTPNLNLEYIFYKIYSFFAEGYNFVFGGATGSGNVIYWVKVFSALFCFLAALGIIYSFIKLVKVKKKQIAEFAKIIIEAPHEERRSKWEKIKKYAESDSSSDWRMAILEADSLLDDIIKKIGYPGETFGERLANINPSQFKSLDEVWHAHKMRNRIAHEGARFELTKDETGYILGLYEKALVEFEYI
ncbi:hypothetical protein KKB69_00480 [Patescibacteria group bacterium]|nr:hypothetical protein [Patescibacteria group bacterium]